MSKCAVSGDKHTFIFTLVNEEGDYKVKQYITCIGCGERRAITNKGILIQFNGEDWGEISPPTIPKED